MPVTKEFTVFLEDRAGTLGKICQALADHGVNILALDSFSSGGRALLDSSSTIRRRLTRRWRMRV